METLATQQTERKSFDVLASVDLARFDIQRFGGILPETWQRIHDEELSYIAEGINRPLYTEFNLREYNGQLSYFDRGQWRPYVGTLITGLQTARAEAAKDPRKQFQAERAAHDLAVGYQLMKLQAGESLAWHSPFPQAELERYGADFIQGLGYQPNRRLGFLYRAERQVDGSLTLISQSVDNSEPEAFEMALQNRGSINQMRSAYDDTLSQKFGQDVYAGRSLNESAADNAWETIHRHRDLLGYYFNRLEALSADETISRSDLIQAKKRLTYGVWAALKERLDVAVWTGSSNGFAFGEHVIHQEVSQAYDALSRRGEILFGCGGAIQGEAALLEASPEDVFTSIFDREGKDKYGSLSFKCQKGHSNIRPRNRMIEHCKTCGVSVKC